MHKNLMPATKKWIRVAALTFAAILLAIWSASLFAQDNADGRIADLAVQLQQLIDRAISNNETMVDDLGNKVLAPNVEDVAQSLQSEIRSAFESKLARTSDQRAEAVANLNRFIQSAQLNEEAQYVRTVLSPYDESPVEYFAIGKYEALMSTRNNRVLQFGPRSLLPEEQPIEYSDEFVYSPEELESMAVEFILAQAPELQLDRLKTNHGQKGEINYFFDWQTSPDMRIYVGFTTSGEILSYLDTLTTHISE